MSGQPSRTVIVFVLAVAAAFARDDPKTVRLVIDYGDGVQKVFPALEWKDGLTVLAALEQAKKPARGITFEVSGKDATAFLTRIEDVKNEGGGKGKKNWTYKVNGKVADRSCGVFKLNAGDEVVWAFGGSARK